MIVDDSHMKEKAAFIVRRDPGSVGERHAATRKPPGLGARIELLNGLAASVASYPLHVCSDASHLFHHAPRNGSFSGHMDCASKRGSWHSWDFTLGICIEPHRRASLSCAEPVR